MTFLRLLAKGSKTPDSPLHRETLLGHTRDVVACAMAIIDAVGKQGLCALGLETHCEFGRLRRAVVCAALLHDLGKANSHFQQMVRGATRLQAVRHEVLSVALLLCRDEFCEWIFADTDPIMRRAVIWAVLGHHLKAPDGKSIIEVRASGETYLEVYCEHQDFLDTIDYGATEIHASSAIRIAHLKLDLVSKPLEALKGWLKKSIVEHESSSPAERTLSALVKGLLFAADVAGSAIPKERLDPASWATDTLTRTCKKEQLLEIAAKRLGKKERRPFQNEVAASGRRVTFVNAGCGSGKTVAAYLWAANRVGAGRKLFICYPTTGTATEGFRDYVVPANLVREAELLHSRAELDLDGILENDDDDAEVGTVVEKVESLSAWDAPLVVCTVNQVLGLIQNNRRQLAALPPILNALFVFDEIHQYGERIFAALLRFLAIFRGVSVLLMTASLPEPRLQAIRDAVEPEDLGVISGPSSLQNIPRYVVAKSVSEPPWDRIERCLRDEQGKVLWVANTVDRAVVFAREAIKRGLSPVMIYHSRFRYVDRMDRHTAVINAFQDSRPGPALAVTTQVCEVSLDLSAVLLITDLAPVPAIIQRMGRLNRRVTEEEHGTPCEAIFIEPPNIFPYEEADFDPVQVKDWLRRLIELNGAVSQDHLATAFAAVTAATTVSPVLSEWLDGGPFSKSAPLGDAEKTVTVVRTEDAPYCADSRGRPIQKNIVRYSVPMPLKAVAGEISNWGRPLFYALVAPPDRIESTGKEWGERWKTI